MATPTSGTPKQHQLEEDGKRSEHEGSSPDEKVYNKNGQKNLYILKFSYLC